MSTRRTARITPKTSFPQQKSEPAIWIWWFKKYQISSTLILVCLMSHASWCVQEAKNTVEGKNKLNTEVELSWDEVFLLSLEGFVSQHIWFSFQKKKTWMPCLFWLGAGKSVLSAGCSNCTLGKNQQHAKLKFTQWQHEKWIKMWSSENIEFSTLCYGVKSL